MWGKELIFDAAKVRANANIDSLVSCWYQEAKAHLDDLFTDAADETTSSEDTAPIRDPARLPVRPC